MIEEECLIGETPAAEAWSEAALAETSSAVFSRASEVTGYQFGRGDFVMRIYDKTAELGFRRRDAEGVRKAMVADEKRAIEAEIWARAGWQEGEVVTRVEVQVRGVALAELCNRCEAKVRDYVDADDYEAALDEACESMVSQLETGIDGIWAYATRKWLRQVEPNRTRMSRCEVTPWWAMVQRVTFERQGAEPIRRRRKRSAVRSAQTLGSVLSLVTLHGHDAGFLDRTGPVWQLPDEARLARRIEGAGLAKARLDEEVRRACAAAAPIIVADLVENAGSVRGALERLIVRANAAAARFAPAIYPCLSDDGGGGVRDKRGKRAARFDPAGQRALAASHYPHAARAS